MQDKNIQQIGYNFLNLPNAFSINNNRDSQIFLYRADGVKLRKFNNSTDDQGQSYGTYTEYVDGFHYLQTSGTQSLNYNPLEYAYEQEAYINETFDDKPIPALQFFPTAEGFYDYENNEYISQYKDHLGNVRVSYKKSGNGTEITDQNNYYPFGMNIPREEKSIVGNASLYNYKYNGKELQETGMYDYGARMYMPDIGRWGVVDPLAEKMTRHSPYNYAFNNPIRFIDPDGRQSEDIVFRGTDKKELRIITAGPDKVVNVPFDLNKNTTVDVGMGNIDPGRLAVGFTAQGDLGVGAGTGVGGGVQMSVVQFTDATYSGYNYVYAGAQESFSAGAQANISASIGGSVSVAYNTSKDNIDPTDYAGVNSSAGVSADAKYVFGGGLNISAFSGSGKNDGWKGVSIGASVGVGAGANLGAGNATLSKTWLLNDVKPTSQRSFLDRATNRINPVGAAVATGVGTWLKNNVKHTPQFN